MMGLKGWGGLHKKNFIHNLTFLKLHTIYLCNKGNKDHYHMGNYT